MTATVIADVECPHGLGDSRWCGACKAALGYVPGTTRQRGDCGINTVVNLTAATYPEAERLLAAAGKQTGKGSQPRHVVAALEAAGCKVTPSALSPMEAMSYSDRSGVSYFVASWAGGQGHGYAIVNGAAIDAGTKFIQARRYRVFRVD